jgi:TetR/AcrR family transcriptional regulator, transcriptional repressor for nem operon
MGRVREFVIEEAVDQACELFWANGFEGTSLSDLTDGLHIQRASLYSAFGSKAELFEKALVHYQKNSLEQLKSLLASGTDAVDSLRQLLVCAVPEADKPRRGCFCVNVAVELGPHDPEIARLLERHFEQVRAIIAQRVAAGQAQGLIVLDLSPLEAGAYVLTCLNGLHVAAKTATDASVIRRTAERMLRALIA